MKTLLRPLPRRATLHRYPILKWFAQAARRRPYLWTFRPATVIPAFYAGSVLALLPLWGVQIPLAFGLALLLRANLPTMVGLQFITNPFTFWWIYPLLYKIGHYLVDLLGQYDPGSMVGRKAYALVLGGVASGILLGFVLSMVYRFLAYEAAKHSWHMPRRAKAKDSTSPAPPPVQKD